MKTRKRPSGLSAAALIIMLVLSGCSIFRATGRAANAVGQGAAGVVTTTGETVGDAADAVTAPLR